MRKVSTCLVGVDFSEGSYKAVEYALMLARLLEGNVELFHAADPDDLTDSHNQMVVQRSVNRLMTTSEKRLRSLCEMIGEKWSIPVRYSVTIGAFPDVLQNEISLKKPDIVCLGRTSHTRILKKALADVDVPLVVVPSTASLREPKEFLLVTDMKPVHADVIKPLLRLTIRKRTPVMHLLDSNVNGHRNHAAAASWSADFSRRFGIATEQVRQKIVKVSNGLVALPETTNADLICTIRRQRNFFSELFTRDRTADLVLNSEVPTLILYDNKKSNGSEIFNRSVFFQNSN